MFLVRKLTILVVVALCFAAHGIVSASGASSPYDVDVIVRQNGDVPVMIWYPASAGERFPLILASHGIGMCAPDLRYLAQAPERGCYASGPTCSTRIISWSSCERMWQCQT